MQKPLSKRFFVDLLLEIQFNKDPVIIPWEVLRVINLIRSEIFESVYLNVLFFDKLVQRQCCIFRDMQCFVL